VRPGPRLPNRFFARSPVEVSPELLGCWLSRTLHDGTRLLGRIVEVEAYLGDGSDPSSHAHPGPTPRNRSMFGPPGRLYAYLSYGVHVCANVVCEPAGSGAAILLRAVEPIGGEPTMRRLRGLADDADRRLVASGPGRLAQAFGLALEDDGTSLGTRDLSIHRPPAGSPAPGVTRGPRIGISRAVELPYRFFVEGDRFVSGPRTKRRPVVSRRRRTG